MLVISTMKLYKHQIDVLQRTASYNRVAFYLDMGLGKTFVGSEKLKLLDAMVNLIICQKSKVPDWVEHFKRHYDYQVYDLTKKDDFKAFIYAKGRKVGIINYDLVWRRPELKQLEEFTLVLDESSLIQNETTKRSKYILNLRPKNVILLSGTPTSGKYETLWSQMHLLGWKINKDLYYNSYVDFHWDTRQGFPLRIIDGYKNVERLKRKMREHGCVFMKTEECISLPEQNEHTVNVPVSDEYKIFVKDRIVEVDGVTLVGDTTLTKLLYERQLCGQYNKAKLEAFKDLVESTNDRLIVFYNFNAELELLKGVCELVGRPYSLVNGQGRDLYAYENESASITLIQYQAGSKGLNLQKANKVIYFTPTLSCDDYMQSRKRVHRISQTKPCFYYHMIAKGSVEERIYQTLARREDYTNALFESEERDAEG